MQEFESGTVSTMLLHAVILNAIPHASLDLVQRMGFSDRLGAMRCHNSKAILLYDTLAQKAQLVSLQTSILLGTFQVSWTDDKDFRFWHHNAVRIATRMGFHRKYVFWSHASQ